MKKLWALFLLISFLGTTSCKYRKYLVRTVQMDANTQKITYQGANGTPITQDNKANIQEGSKVDIIVVNFNPLNQSVTVNPIQSIINYQSPSALTTAFFSLPAAAPAVPPAAGNPADIKGRPKPGTGTKAATAPVCDKSQALYKALADYYKFSGEYKANYQNFKLFYNNLSYLNSQYNEFKLDNGLLQSCLCDYLKAFDIKIIGLTRVAHTISGMGNDPIQVTCPPNPGGCEVTSYTTEMQQANISYKQYFSDVADSLGKIQIAIGKLIKGVDFKTYLKQNFASCMEDPIVATMIDQKFSDDLTQDLATYKSINTLYTQYDKDITSNINEYSIMLHLNFVFVQANNLVAGTDEFKANVMVTNSTTPSANYTFNIDLPVTRMVKIDFSAGGFFSTLTNEAAQLKKKMGVDSFMVTKYKTNNYSVGPMGYINFHSQVPNGVQWGAFLGTGLNFNQTTSVALAAGGEIVLGKFQRILLHAGVAMSQVSRVSSLYPDGSYFADGTYSPAIIQKWDAKFMFGISWNLSKTQ
jgi:hypothetical protein